MPTATRQFQVTLTQDITTLYIPDLTGLDIARVELNIQPTTSFTWNKTTATLTIKAYKDDSIFILYNLIF